VAIACSGARNFSFHAVFHPLYGFYSSARPDAFDRKFTIERIAIMKMRMFLLSAAALAAVCAPSAFAQSSTTTSDPQSIAQRKDNQQDRIAQGVDSGQLTAGETKNLENKEAGLNKEEHVMRSEDDGHLTSADRATLNNQQNHLSNQIYDDKHNTNTAAHYANTEVGQRRENQQDRIAQGVKSGQLTAGETSRLENQEQGLNREVSGMRQANGGKLTKGDKALVNRQQNAESRRIYRDKHNARHTRP
jgi:hypothetical protein